MSSLWYNFRLRCDTSKSLDRESKTTDNKETPTARRGRPPTKEFTGRRISKSASSSRDRTRLTPEERDRQLSAL